jgi:hypothetical protein
VDSSTWVAVIGVWRAFTAGLRHDHPIKAQTKERP